MSKAVPHFTAEWLEQYNQRLHKTKAQAHAPDEGAGTACPKSRARARAVQDPTPCDGELIPYSAESRPVEIHGWTGKQTETEKRYNATMLYGHGRFEAVCLYLPGGGRYTPDFMTMDDGIVTFHEVKGSYRLHSQGRAYTAFHEAAAAFPCFRFVWATERKGGGFDVKRFNSTAIDERNSN